MLGKLEMIQMKSKEEKKHMIMNRVSVSVSSISGDLI